MADSFRRGSLGGPGVVGTQYVQYLQRGLPVVPIQGGSREMGVALGMETQWEGVGATRKMGSWS
jgi:hypothetical protein